jgi:hypothetical protein
VLEMLSLFYGYTSTKRELIAILPMTTVGFDVMHFSKRTSP